MAHNNEKEYSDEMGDKGPNSTVITRGGAAELGEGDRTPPENDLHRGLKARQYVVTLFCHPLRRC
jgi:hypothetical protein